MTNITAQCARCGGTGIDDNKKDEQGNPVPESCTTCGGDGKIEISSMDTESMEATLDWLKKKIQKILHKLEIEDE